MKKLVALLLVSMMATVAFAGLDPDSDSFGVYFDTLGNTNVAAPMGATVSTQRTFYILLMNPTTQIKGFELAYELTPSGNMDDGINGIFADELVRNLITISGGSYVDVGSSGGAVSGDFRCGYATPRPAEPAMLLVTMRYRYYGAEDQGIGFVIKGVATNPSPGSNGYPVIDGGAGIGLRQGGIASGDPTAPCATTGGLAGTPVAVESESFGAVKALFR